MFYVLSRTLGFFLVPSNLLASIGLIGIVLLPTRFSRTGRQLLVTSFLLVALIGLLPIGNALTLPLEARFPRWDPARGPPTGIVTIGGVIDPEISAGRGDVALSDAAERVTAVVKLARRYPDAKILFAGGNGNLISEGPSEASFAIQLFENLGVPRSRIILETRSRNTAENATFSKQLAAPKPGEGWLLVTSAMHMPRAIGVFRKAGFPIEAYPVDYQTAGPQDLWTLSGSLLGGISKTDASVHEWLGLVIYWATGRIDALFPGPT